MRKGRHPESQKKRKEFHDNKQEKKRLKDWERRCVEPPQMTFGPSKLFIAACGILIIISLLLYCVPHDGILSTELVKPDAMLVLIDKRYLKPDGILVISLLNEGSSIDSVTRSDFKYFLDGCGMGTVYAIYFANGQEGKWGKGETIQISLRLEENTYGSKVILTFRGTPIEFSV